MKKYVKSQKGSELVENIVMFSILLGAASFLAAGAVTNMNRGAADSQGNGNAGKSDETINVSQNSNGSIASSNGGNITTTIPQPKVSYTLRTCIGDGGVVCKGSSNTSYQVADFCVESTIPDGEVFVSDKIYGTDTMSASDYIACKSGQHFTKQNSDGKPTTVGITAIQKYGGVSSTPYPVTVTLKAADKLDDPSGWISPQYKTLSEDGKDGTNTVFYSRMFHAETTVKGASLYVRIPNWSKYKDKTKVDGELFEDTLSRNFENPSEPYEMTVWQEEGGRSASKTFSLDKNGESPTISGAERIDAPEITFDPTTPSSPDYSFDGANFYQTLKNIKVTRVGNWNKDIFKGFESATMKTQITVSSSFESPSATSGTLPISTEVPFTSDSAEWNLNLQPGYESGLRNENGDQAIFINVKALNILNVSGKTIFGKEATTKFRLNKKGTLASVSPALTFNHSTDDSKSPVVTTYRYDVSLPNSSVNNSEISVNGVSPTYKAYVYDTNAGTTANALDSFDLELGKESTKSVVNKSSSAVNRTVVLVRSLTIDGTTISSKSETKITIPGQSSFRHCEMNLSGTVYKKTSADKTWINNVRMITVQRQESRGNITLTLTRTGGAAATLYASSTYISPSNFNPTKKDAYSDGTITIPENASVYYLFIENASGGSDMTFYITSHQEYKTTVNGVQVTVNPPGTRTPEYTIYGGRPSDDTSSLAAVVYCDPSNTIEKCDSVYTAFKYSKNVLVSSRFQTSKDIKNNFHVKINEQDDGSVTTYYAVKCGGNVVQSGLTNSNVITLQNDEEADKSYDIYAMCKVKIDSTRGSFIINGSASGGSPYNLTGCRNTNANGVYGYIRTITVKGTVAAPYCTAAYVNAVNHNHWNARFQNGSSLYAVDMQVIIQGGDRWGHMFRIYDRDGEWTSDSLGSKTSFGTISLAKKGSSGDGVFHWFGSHDNRAWWHWDALARTGSAWCRLYMDGVWSNWYGANIGQADFDYHDDHENHGQMKVVTDYYGWDPLYSQNGHPWLYNDQLKQ
jgi:hypothetical protein